MKKSIILSVIALAVSIVTNAQTVFVLQNGDRAQFFQKLEDVMANLLPGDTLYLPTKPLTGDLILKKKVHVIGAGYHPDSAAVSGITKITGSLEFTEESEGSSITGIRVEKDVRVKVSYISISRCNMANLDISNNTSTAQPITQTYVTDCVIRGNLNGSNNVVTSTLIERCVVHGQIESGDKTNNMMIKNCVLLHEGNYYAYSGLRNLIIENSIILEKAGFIFCSNYGSFNSSGLTLNNNLWARTEEVGHPSFSMKQNVYGIAKEDIFEDVANGDYRIKPTCTQALTLATDGKEVGIFGTDYPFLVPTYAPRFVSIDNAENVVNGKLSVKMKVEARNR